MLSVREITLNDVERILNYWYSASPDFLKSMGADISKLPSREEFKARLHNQIALPYKQKPSYCMVWLENGEPMGHCNVNDIVFGEHAFMHLHMWDPSNRKKGGGSEFIKRCLPFFFKNLELKSLFCEPYANNAAPNKTLPKAGFTFLKKHLTVPSTICFEQEVNRWEIKREALNS